MSNKTKKASALLLSLALLLSVAISGTLAFLTAESSSVVNTFVPAKVESCIVPDNENEYSFTISNPKDDAEKNIPAYIRAAVVATWQKTEGNTTFTYYQAPNCTISFSDDDWVKGDDGYYYCKNVVDVNADAGQITVTPSETAPDGYTFTVEVLAEAIQAYGMGATNAQQAWSIASGN